MSGSFQPDRAVPESSATLMMQLRAAEAKANAAKQKVLEETGVGVVARRVTQIMVAPAPLADQRERIARQREQYAERLAYQASRRRRGWNINDPDDGSEGSEILIPDELGCVD